MNTIRRLSICCLLLTALCLLLPSCAVPNPPSKVATTKNSPEPQLATDMQAWMHGLRDDIKALSETNHQLPGRDEGEHRKLMADAFGSLAKILPQLHGPMKTGQFDQQLRTIETTRSQLGAGSAALSIEPTIDYGLRATAGALTDIQHGNTAFTDAAPNIEQLQQQIDQLDTQRGALHRAAQGDVVDSITRVVQSMSKALDEKMSGQSAAGDK